MAEGRKHSQKIKKADFESKLNSKLGSQWRENSRNVCLSTISVENSIITKETKRHGRQKDIDPSIIDPKHIIRHEPTITHPKIDRKHPESTINLTKQHLRLDLKPQIKHIKEIKNKTKTPRSNPNM